MDWFGSHAAPKAITVSPMYVYFEGVAYINQA